ncbi:uncharacterized protein LOC129768745 [Toxorhynchites rutilus septentrionalis]|uniref:uncharacterized protein LOC129768745 n=1 Tax=Toxorhynchites rutilus septentrionalis TaxID=329112 RepID=UPI002479CC7C|nr:uncharacterized protein LOC129768745 [Toxorhynchites rutilus septentrionalis]
MDPVCEGTNVGGPLPEERVTNCVNEMGVPDHTLSDSGINVNSNVNGTPRSPNSDSNQGCANINGGSSSQITRFNHQNCVNINLIQSVPSNCNLVYDNSNNPCSNRMQYSHNRSDDGQSTDLLILTNKAKHSSKAQPSPKCESRMRELRRKERRERRRVRKRLQCVYSKNFLPQSSSPADSVPEIHRNRLPPPYSALPAGNGLLTGSGLAGESHINRHHSFSARSSSPSHSRKSCCSFSFPGPSLRALIALVALSGIACAFGGAALGTSGIGSSPISHLLVALLMVGVGVTLMMVSAAAWRITSSTEASCFGSVSSAPDDRFPSRYSSDPRDGPTQEFLYQEFQHRAPPPSYQASTRENNQR